MATTRPGRAPGQNAPEVWTPEAIARLGVDTDTQIAADLGITVSAVALRRRKLGIPRSPAAALEPRRWSAEDDRLLGTMPDRELAQALGIPRGAVERRRVALDVRPYIVGVRRELHELAGAAYIDDYRAGVPVADIARKHAVSAATVTKAIERYLARELGAATLIPCAP